MVRIRLPSAVNGVIKGAGVLDDIANLIANPPDNSPVGGAIGRGGQRFCDALASAPALAFGILQSQGVVGAIVCKPYFDGAGIPTPEQGPPVLTGGQCAAAYEVFTTTRNPNGTINPEVFSGVFNGPFSFDAGTALPDPCDPGFTRIGEQFLRDGSGTVLFAGGNGCFANPPFATFRFVPIGGGPDECGDQEGEFVPGPGAPPFPPDYTPGVDFGIDGDGEPFFDVPGIPDPFDPDAPPIPFEDPFRPDLPQPSGDNLPGEPDAIGNPIGSGAAGDAGEDFSFGEPPLGKIWVGCLVEFAVDNAYGSIPNTGPENTVYPLTIGNISLRYGALRGTSVQVRSRFTELFRQNTALEVTGVFVQTRPNTSAIVRPISVTVCKETQCSGE